MFSQLNRLCVFRTEILFKNIFVRNYKKSPKHKHNEYYNYANFNQIENGNKLEIKFHYKHRTMTSIKAFIFSRCIDESVSDSLKAMEKNLTKRILRSKPDKFELLAKNADECTTNTKKDDKHLLSRLHVNLGLINKHNEEVIQTWEELISGEELEQCIFTVDGRKYDILLNIPQIEDIRLPAIIEAGSICYPDILKMNFANITDCKFKWYKKPKGRIFDWTIYAENSPIYETVRSDIGHFLKLECLPKRGKVCGEPMDAMSYVKEAETKLELIDRRLSYTPDFLPNGKFRVVSYNLLADFYTDSDFTRYELFPYCSPDFLNVDYRKQLWIRELLGFKSDVICLQELDEYIFQHDFSLCFSHLHYDGMFLKKPGIPEGLGIFYNKNRFSLFSENGIILRDSIPTLELFQSLYDKIRFNFVLCEKLLSVPTVLQVAVLNSTTDNRYLVIANTHLFANPAAKELRLVQMAFMLSYIQYIYKATIEETGCSDEQISVVFCGDFNSKPSTEVFEFVMNGSISKSSTNSEILIQDLSFDHNFEFETAYNDPIPKYTNFVANFNGCLDYIFYEKCKLRVLQTVPITAEEDLKICTALPSMEFPSDHLALVSDFEWK